MEDLLVKYGIVFGKRYSLKQRQRFLLALNEEFNQLGYKTKFANDEKKNNARAVNLFIGDIGSADTIICTHHDTPMKVLWPGYRYYPLNGQRSFRTTWLVTLIPGILASLLAGIAIYLIISNPDFGGAWRPFWLFLVVLSAFLLATLVSKGLSNKYNINRNTASILAILETAKQLNKAAANKVAFILLDKGCSDNRGALMLQKALPTTMDRKVFVYLDCIGQGQNLIIAHKEHLKKESEKLRKNYHGTQETETKELDDGEIIYTPAYFFKRAIIITNGNYDKSGNLYVEKVNSSADKYADIETIQAVAKMLADSYNK